MIVIQNEQRITNAAQSRSTIGLVVVLDERIIAEALIEPN